MRSIVAASVCLVSFVWGCRRETPADTHGNAVAPSASTSAAPSAAVANAAPPPVAVLADGESKAFRGTVDGAPVVVRLHRSGVSLEGTYFYEKHGVDLALRGSVLPTGEWTLDEEVGGKPTGHFQGRANADGSVAGEWSAVGGKAGTPRPFVLRPASRESPLGAVPLFTKHVRARKKAKTPGMGGMQTECTLDLTYLEVVGAPTDAAERAINRALRPEHDTLDECDVGDTFESSPRVAFNDQGILSVVYGEAFCCGAYPSYSSRFVNLTTIDGATLTLGGLVRPGAQKKLQSLVRGAVKKRFSTDPAWGATSNDELEDAVTALTDAKADFSIEPKGLSLSLFNHEPHVIQALFADGFVVPYAALKDVLARPGPLDPLLPP